MNNRLRNLIIIFLTFLFVIFLLNIFIRGIETNKSDITNMKILNYIPREYEFTILSNSTNKNIKKYITENISEKKRDELNMIKNSFISYLGFDLQEKIEDIYDNEFALTFFGNKLNKNDILLIFKLKKNKNINHIINIGEKLNKYNEIIELKRLDKLNYISHIYQTKDNYIIASSNENLIHNSLQSNNNSDELFSRILMPEDINLKEIQLLSISKYKNSNNNYNLEEETENELITIINSEDNKIKLRLFTPNININNTKIINNKTKNIKDIIFTNKYSSNIQSINFLFNDINQKEFLEKIYQEVNDRILFITNDNNWVICFKRKLPNEDFADQFNFLKKYKKEDLYINNINYSIYTNDRLKIIDNSIIYEEANPIFSLKDEMNIYISNNFDALLNITEKPILSNQYLKNNSEIEHYKYILNDIFFIKNINNKELIKYFKPLKNLQYFINTELFSLEDTNINISHNIPERHEKVYLESNLKIL